MGVTCPNCNQSEPEGALFCPECGSKMIGVDGLSLLKGLPNRLSNKSNSSESPDPDNSETETAISLHIIQTGQILPLLGREEFTIGRVSEGQSILPDIDLTPYDAYTNGVSRLHATVKIKDDNVIVSDLGSANGIKVNNEKILPNADSKINHGDLLSLGKLKIQILIRKNQMNKVQ